MKSVYKYLGVIALASVLSVQATAQDNGVSLYLSNDCEEPVHDEALVRNAAEWQDVLIKVAFNGPDQTDLDVQRIYLEDKYEKMKVAVERGDYAWVTEENKVKILGRSKEDFVSRELNNFSTKYKEQALRGLGMLREMNLLSESMDMDVTVYPNPASEFVTVSARLSAESSYKITVFDLAGGSIADEFDGEGDAVEYQFSVVDIPVGVYLIQVMTSAGELATERLVVE